MRRRAAASNRPLRPFYPLPELPCRCGGCLNRDAVAYYEFSSGYTVPVCDRCWERSREVEAVQGRRDLPPRRDVVW